MMKRSERDHLIVQLVALLEVAKVGAFRYNLSEFTVPEEYEQSPRALTSVIDGLLMEPEITGKVGDWILTPVDNSYDVQFTRLTKVYGPKGDREVEE